jgi:hypothetical protein
MPRSEKLYRAREVVFVSEGFEVVTLGAEEQSSETDKGAVATAVKKVKRKGLTAHSGNMSPASIRM